MKKLDKSNIERKNMKLFIDANIYLRFYDSNSRQFKKLLSSLQELKDNIFVTAQIADEVRRNKLGVAVSSFSEYSKRMGMQATTLPEHFDDDDNLKMKKWNDKRSELIDAEKLLSENFAAIASETIEAIMTSSDKVSVMLEDLFEKAFIATDATLLAAKRRKEIGNPPGKTGDPLGDQISWEQLIDAYDGQDKLWIISNDHDFIDIYKKQPYLNAFLYRELAIKSAAVPIVYCFDSLAIGLKHFDQESGYKVKELPSHDILEEIIFEESLGIVDSSNINSIGYDQSTQTLRVRFLNGAEYDYKNVPVMEFEQLKNAQSVGSYLNRYIKGNYAFDRVV